jgi:Flp pilus assembly protein TadD
MFRRWFRACLLPSALCLTAAGCTTSIESLTGGFITSGTPAPKGGGEVAPLRNSDDLPANDQLRLHLDTAKQLDTGGNDQGALEEYERVLQLDRTNYTAMRRLCVLYDRRGSRDDFKKAEEVYRKVADLRPKDADVWSDWGYSLFLRTDKENCKENWAEAEKKLRQALKLDPQHARAHTNLGLVLGQMERYDEAYREFRAAQLSESEAHCDMAFVYWQKGKLEDAKQECRIARDKDPALAKASEMLTVLEQAGHPHEKGGPLARGEGRPRNSMTAAEREEAEHEAARRAVAGLSGGTSASLPMPSGAMSAPDDGKVVKWQTSGPIVMPSGSQWMPTKAGAAPAPTAPTPMPVTDGVPGTITLPE